MENELVSSRVIMIEGARCLFVSTLGLYGLSCPMPGCDEQKSGSFHSARPPALC